MNRKIRGIFVSVLLLTLAGLLIAKVVANDDPSTSALSGIATLAAGSATPPANAPATLERNKNRPANASKGERNAAQVAIAGQAKNSAANADRSNTKTNTTPERKSAAASAPHQPTEAITKLTPLEPRAEPYALVANSGSVNVRFSVRTIGGSNQTAAVYLRQSGMPDGIALNDLGMEGDLVAGDRIYGANIVMDTSRLEPDACLSYEAFISDGESDAVSSPLRLCVSNLPVRTAASNTDNPVVFSDGSKAVADEILITAQPGTKAAAIQQIAASINATIVGSIPPLNLYQLKLAAPATEAQLAALVGQLNARPEVKGASVNAIGHATAAPNDPEYASQHGLQRVRAQDVWDIGATGNGVVVTVLDTGIDRTHPDFGTVGNCQLAENDCGSANTDTAVEGTAAGHGTQVAGIIAAKTNNSLGVAGIAPGSKIHSIKIADYAIAGMTQSFTDAAAYGAASVINASFIGEWAPTSWAYAPSLTALCTSINSAVMNGSMPVAVVVNAAGNNGMNGDFYPARCNDSTNALHGQLTRKDLLITVANSISSLPVDPLCANAAAVDQRCGGTTTGIYYTSNYGAWVDIAAPGTQIRSTTLVSAGSYASSTGTSFSSPMVAGAVAILKQCGVPLGDDPATPLVIEGIEHVLKTSGANVMVSFPDGSNAPRLDIYRALAQVNHSPTALGLTNNSLNDGTNTAGGVEVGTLTHTDADTCDKHTYSIQPGADADLFSIGGAANDKLILTAGVLNIAAKPSYAVTVRVTDFFGATFNQSLTVNVIAAPPVNHAPVIANQSFNINENSSNGTAVGTVSANDLDAGNTISYSITAGNTGSAFAIAPSTGEITVSNTLSYFTTSTYALTVQVTDNGNLSASATVTINVNNPAVANNQPNISAQSFSVNESSSNGTAVGTVAAIDPDGDSLSYSITAGNTGGAFALNAATGALTVNNPLSYATKPTYALTVQVTDSGGLFATATVTVNVNAASGPAPAPANPPAASGGGGGGGCSVMPVGASPDSSLALAVLVLLGYGVWRRRKV